MTATISLPPLPSLPPRWRKRAPYLALIAAVFIAYCNVYGNAFLFDDDLLITLNQYLRGWATFGHLFTASTIEGAHIAGGFYRPLQNILYFFTFQIAGQSTVAFHLLNVTLHAANACLVYALGRKLNFKPGAVFPGALLWALHPLHTEAVTYMSATADPLYALFCLSGVIVVLPDFAPRKFYLATLFLALGLASKETAVILPLLVMSCMYLCRCDAKTYWRTWPLWLATGAYIIWRLNAPNLDGPQTYQRFYDQPGFANLKIYADTLSFRIYTFFATIPAYLRLLAWPADLHMERDFDVYANPFLPPVMAGVALALASLWLIIRGYRGGRDRSLGWGLLWAAAAQAPNTGIPLPTNALFLEHWMYVPAIGLFLGAAQAVALALARPDRQKFRPAAVAACLIAATALGARTLDQNAVWRDPITFYTHIFKYSAGSARCHNNIALAYMQRGEVDKAIAEFRRAIELGDGYAETHHNLAIALLTVNDGRNHIPEAIGEFNRALAIDPNFYRSYLALAAVYAHAGDHDKEAYYTEKAVRIHGPFAP